jgi:hypothetical protein
LLRCEVQDDPGYRAAVDALGGVSWGYAVQLLDDHSQPEFRLGPPPPIAPQQQYPSAAGATNDAAPVPVEIEEADIVALSESLALFYSVSHGLLLVDLTGTEPRFKCGVKLPGQVQNFFYYRDQLVAMMGATLLHFKLGQGNLQFVESIALRGPSLDTRRFNDKLVVYTRLEITKPSTPAPIPRGPAGGIGTAPAVYVQPKQHRALQVFKFGDKLLEELNESLINTSVDMAYLQSGVVAEDTAPGTVVHTSSVFGDVLWASDHYFVVTELLDVTKLDSWVTQSYQVCTASHTVKTPYRHCSARYETRPNPSYTPPDNPSGDRACKGVTLADCLRTVAQVSSPTIQVPVSTSCEERTYEQWFCDAYSFRSYRYPQLKVDSATRLSIYEYTADGFVRLDGKVRAIVTKGELDGVPLDIRVDKLTTSSEAYDLSIPGHLQTLQFQNGFMYAIASGVLQVYSMAENSLVRTSSLQVANNTLQSSLFSSNKLYLSDYGYAFGMDHSTLRVIDLSNGGFPKQVSQDYQLPGGHTSILPTSQGILTIGAVANFENVTHNAVKLGLFADPFTTEKAYLILATEFASVFLAETKAHYFDANNDRLFLPYTGSPRAGSSSEARIGISHLTADAIVSDGALRVLEPIQRVRPRPGTSDQLLGFGANTIAWIKPDGATWQTSSVLSYYTPIALYRLSDSDDYVEVSRLGESCKLHFANATELGTPAALKESAAFDCGNGAPLAYGHNLLFGDSRGVSFDDDDTLHALDAAKAAQLAAQAAQRPTCLFSQTPTMQAIDYSKLPPPDDLKCYTPAEYQALLTKLQSASNVRPLQP